MAQKSFWLLGSGRWAKIIAAQLPLAFGENTIINVVTSRDPKDVMEDFSNSSVRLDTITGDVPKNLKIDTNFAIVCGSTKSNTQSVSKSILSGLNFYVEKPFSLNVTDLHSLVHNANSLNLNTYPSNVFYFQNNIYNLLFAHEKKSGRCLYDYIKFTWTDKCELDMFVGSSKYNPALTVFEDVLPHLLPIACKLIDVASLDLCSVNVDRMGQAMQLNFRAKNCEIEINIERNGEKRRRLLDLTKNGKTLNYDFSSRDGSLDYIKKYMPYNKSSYLGPLSLSLFDFVRSSNAKKISPFNNLKYTNLTLELFPKINEQYMRKIKKLSLGLDRLDAGAVLDSDYLVNEITARLSDKAIDCDYIDRITMHEVKQALCANYKTKH
jgi:hypothetical protein